MDVVGTWRTLRSNAQNPVMRRNIAWLMTGKFLGLAAVIGVITWALPAIAS